MYEIIDGYSNSFKVKYLYMDKLFNGKLEESKLDIVNIYINFESLYNCIRNKNVEQHLKTATKKELSSIYRCMISNFINVAAHYRKYFFNKKIKTRIFFYYNKLSTDRIDYNNSSLIPKYRNHFFKSINNLDRITVNSIIHESIQFMKIITEYIQDIYMIETDSVEASVSPFIIDMSNKYPANINIIISKDTYDIQYVNYNFLFISKFNQEPVLITKRNAIKYLLFKEKVADPARLINPLLIPFILSCIGDRKRSIPGVKGFGFVKTYKALVKLYEAGYLIDDDYETFSISNLMHIINNEDSILSSRNDLATELLKSFKVTDLESQYSVISDIQQDKILEQLTNKTDTDALIDINEKYFTDYPLMLLELNQFDKNKSLLEEEFNGY